ncbi:MAG: HAD family phosphatase [Phycisphaerae bacterium]|nr:HAD family phosphatase [Phycisphaerae bacterium]
MNEKPADIRLVAIDLDGTLLDARKRVSQQTIDGLASAAGKGIRIVIASARPPRSVRAIYQMLKLDTLQINYNGALIWDEIHRRAVFHRPLDGFLVQEMVELARDYHEEVIVHLESMDRWSTDRTGDAYQTETGKMFKPDRVGELTEFYHEPVTKLLFLGEPRIISRLEDLMVAEFVDRVTIVRTDDELLQVMHPHVSKAKALQKVAKVYGVPDESILAIGDAPNDVGMLQIAGIAVAMGNASPVVKEVVDWIAPSNNDHGVHAALVKYGLCSV